MNRLQKRVISLGLCLLCSMTMLFTTTSVEAKYNKNVPKVTEEKYDKHVLFLGNSYTYFNDLPKIFKLLCKSSGYNVLSDSITESGGILLNFSDTKSNLEYTQSRVADILNTKLKTKWDVVVLQEQSQIPTLSEDCNKLMYPTIRELNTKITKTGAKPMLFMTWGYKDGDVEHGYKTYEDMQEALRKSYTNIAEELSLPISPVGLAFLKAKQKDKNINLWIDENSHPTVEGSYLTACVFYAKIFGKSPVDLKYTAGLSTKRALFLQNIANETVLKSKK